MEKRLKIAIWTTGILTLGIGGTLTYFGVKRSKIRKCLEEKYADTSGEDAVGGINKLLVSEIFDKRTFLTSSKATITRVEARERAEQVWENYSSWFSSNSTAIVKAFDGLGHAHDVSKIAFEFHSSYDEDLLSVLKNALDSSSVEYRVLIGKLSKLPKE